MAQIRQSRPKSGLDLQVKIRQPFQLVPSSLGSGWQEALSVLERGAETASVYATSTHQGRERAREIDRSSERESERSRERERESQRAHARPLESSQPLPSRAVSRQPLPSRAVSHHSLFGTEADGEAQAPYPGEYL
jgi:hypothetical protein